MIRSVLVATSLLWSATLAHAEDAEEEKYLLGDLGTRIDLPASWKMLRWSDWDFRAEPADGKMQLYAWGTPVQQEIVAEDLEAWAGVHLGKVESLNGTDAAVATTQLLDVAGRAAARVDISFRFGGKSDALLLGASVPVEGQTLHVALLTAAVRKAKAEKTMAGILERLDVRKPPAEVQWGAEVSGNGFKATLPDGWRQALAQEASLVVAGAKALGVEELEPCWTALRPKAGGDPDVMFTCPTGAVMDIGVGLADEASFSQVDAALRPKLFGTAEVAPGTRVVAGERTGFLYAPDIGGRGLAMGVVGYGDGLAQTWASGDKSALEGLTAAVSAVMESGEYEGEYPVTVSERISYAISFNPTSPLVLGPGALFLGLVGGGIFLATRQRRDPYADFDE